MEAKCVEALDSVLSVSEGIGEMRLWLSSEREMERFSMREHDRDTDRHLNQLESEFMRRTPMLSRDKEVDADEDEGDGE